MNPIPSAHLRSDKDAPRRSPLAALLLASGLVASCADAGYYAQSVGGHLRLLALARPVPDWIHDPAASAVLKTRLDLAQRMRTFAATELRLPDNPSYRRYAQLDRRAAVWNVVAAAPDSLTLKTWCFPVAGCVGYRGYYDKQAADDLARQLEQQGLEAAVLPVPAYSTLGFSNWLGGDPLLSTFIFYPEGELARLIFHELAHQELYVKDDTTFNESFATAVERLGAQRWLERNGTARAQAEYESFDARRRAFRALALAARRSLEQIYLSHEANPLGPALLAAAKKEVLDDFRAQWARLRAQWRAADPSADPRWLVGYDAWVAQANNARFGALAAYDELVPGFLRLFEREQGDWVRFYEAVRQLGALPRAERRRQLADF